MEHLFDETHKYNDVGDAIDNATKQACQGIMDTWTDLGYSPGEIYYVMSQAINDLSLDKLLGLK